MSQCARATLSPIRPKPIATIGSALDALDSRVLKSCVLINNVVRQQTSYY